MNPESTFCHANEVHHSWFGAKTCAYYETTVQVTHGWIGWMLTSVLEGKCKPPIGYIYIYICVKVEGLPKWWFPLGVLFNHLNCVPSNSETPLGFHFPS